MKRMSLFTMFVLWVLCSSSSVEQSQDEYHQLNGLEVIVPQGFSVNSHMIDGVLQTSFRKEGGSLSSLLIVSVCDAGEEFSNEELSDALSGLKMSFESMGYEIGVFTKYSTPNYNGYKAEATGTYMGIPITLILKICTISHYYVQFLEYYGEDYSADYAKIEESLRVSKELRTTGSQTISDGRYSFTYDADKMIAVKSRKDGTTTFTFTSTKSDDTDSFMEINFTEKSVNDIFAFATDWFPMFKELMSGYYKEMNLGSMEHISFLGHPGYVWSGYATISVSNTPVLLTFKVCRHKGKFVWAVIQQSLDGNMSPSQDTQKLFNDVELSMESTDESF